MYETNRDDFYKWYDEQKNNIFDFDKEIVEYCISERGFKKVFIQQSCHYSFLFFYIVNNIIVVLFI